jgi:hypothetical protein
LSLLHTFSKWAATRANFTPDFLQINYLQPEGHYSLQLWQIYNFFCFPSLCENKLIQMTKKCSFGRACGRFIGLSSRATKFAVSFWRKLLELSVSCLNTKSIWPWVHGGHSFSQRSWYLGPSSRFCRYIAGCKRFRHPIHAAWADLCCQTSPSVKATFTLSFFWSLSPCQVTIPAIFHPYDF